MAEIPDKGENVKISKDWMKPASELDDSTDRMMKLLNKKLDQFQQEEIIDIPIKIKKLEMDKVEPSKC